MRNTVQLFKSLADGNRVRIIKMLEFKSLCVCELTEILQLATSTVSKHLSILKYAGLIIDSKNGRWVNYELNRSENPLIIHDVLSLISKSDTSAPAFSHDLDRVKTIDRDTICNR